MKRRSFNHLLSLLRDGLAVQTLKLSCIDFCEWNLWREHWLILKIKRHLSKCSLECVWKAAAQLKSKSPLVSFRFLLETKHTGIGLLAMQASGAQIALAWKEHLSPCHVCKPPACWVTQAEMLKSFMSVTNRPSSLVCSSSILICQVTLKYGVKHSLLKSPPIWPLFLFQWLY